MDKSHTETMHIEMQSHQLRALQNSLIRVQYL